MPSPIIHADSWRLDFLVAGTQKGGTSALDTYLRGHPEICMAEKKEVHYFDTDKNFVGNKIDYSAYHSFFEPAASCLVSGEVTPIYMYWYDAPRRIWEYNSRIKLIIVLRNPVDRAYSHWNMERSRGMEKLSFSDAIRTEKQRCQEALPYQHRRFSYVDRGFYLDQLRRIWTYFIEDQILILKNEDLRNNPVSVLNTISRFLDVGLFENIENKEIHALPYKSEISDEDKHYLQHIYEYEIRGLERILGWDCGEWLSG